MARATGELEPILKKLGMALVQASWREVIALTDQILTLAPEHAEALAARAKAWRAVEAPTLARTEETQDAKPHTPVESIPRRLRLWIDGVGGYLLCLEPQITIGQATSEAGVDVAIFADISRLHARIRRDAEGYLVEAVRPVMVNSERIEDSSLLRDGDRVTLGSSCQLRFHQPLPVSATARLEMASGHRLMTALEGVVLMADTCVLGPAGEAHITIPECRRPVVLFRGRDGLGVRVAGELLVDGRAGRDRAVLKPDSTVLHGDLRFTLEPA